MIGLPISFLPISAAFVPVAQRPEDKKPNMALWPIKRKPQAFSAEVVV